MTGTLIAPVIPSPAAAAGRPARAPAAARTLPLAVPPALSRPPALGRDVVYGLARVDRSGRVADRTVTGKWTKLQRHTRSSRPTDYSPQSAQQASRRVSELP